MDGFYNYTYEILTGQGSGVPASMGGYYPTYINYPPRRSNDFPDPIDIKI